MMKNLAIVLLAAGQGRRMKSNRAKVLHTLCGWPMVCHVIARALPLSPERLVIVVGRQGASVREAIASCLPQGRVTFVEQKERLGTGHAVLAAQRALSGFSGDVLILSGDVPLLSTNTMKDFLRRHRQRRCDLSLMSFQPEDPAGYGRILKDDQGQLQGIVEEGEALPAQLALGEVNAGIYLVKAKQLFPLLGKVRNDNKQGEYYLTDIVGLAAAAGRRCRTHPVQNPMEIMGINTRAELARADEILRHGILEVLMDAGVTIIDPLSTFVDIDVRIGQDTILHPNVSLREGTVLGEECVVETGTLILRSRLADNVKVKAYSIIEDAGIDEGAIVGPFARLRSGSQVGRGAMVGNFVELYGASIGDRSKVRRLIYLADIDVGDEVHVGAGVVTCNFDGIDINRTKIGDHVFIGSDSQLIAPVEVGNHAHVATGSTITRDVPQDGLYVTRGKIVMREGWATRYRKIAAMKTKAPGKAGKSPKKKNS